MTRRRSWISALSLSFLAAAPALAGDEKPAAPAAAEKPAVAASKTETPLAPVAAPGAVLQIGAPAPDFKLKATDGTTARLDHLDGQTVVLEWFNPDCPFVVYAHGENGPLRTLAKEWESKGVRWYAVNSGAPGMQGNGLEKNKESRKTYEMDYPVLLDESGEVGRAYGARTTPHIFIIDGNGNLVYQGGLDNAPLGKVEGTRVDFVSEALAAVTSGKPIARAETKPYGCSVKYAKN